MTALDYLRDLSAQMHSRYIGDCAVHACNLAQLLLDAGEQPWIGRIREVEMMGDARVHHPLTPVRFAGRNGPTWTTHYVCCSGTVAYDPLVGEPILIDELAKTIFGRALPVTKVFPEEAIKRGELTPRALRAE